MGLTAKDKGGGDFTPIPEDLHLGVCYAIYDIGTQFSERFGKSVHKVVIVWELPKVRGQFERDGKTIDLPRAISKKYTLSLHKKADMRKDLESWRGKRFTDQELKGFDLKKLLGAPCQIQVIHNKVDEKTYANIAALTKAPTGTKITPENPTAFFSFEEEMDIPQGTPEWISDLIKSSEEYKHGGAFEENGDPGHYPDEVPF